MLSQFLFDNTHSKLCRIDWQVNFFQYIRQCANVVFVSMGDHKALNFLNVVFQISNIWDYQINSQHIVLRECQSAIHNNNTVSEFEGSDVHSDLLKTSERNDSQFSVFPFLQTLHLHVLLHLILIFLQTFFTLAVKF